LIRFNYSLNSSGFSTSSINQSCVSCSSDIVLLICFTVDFSLCFNFSLSEPSLSAFSPLFPEAVVESDFFLSLFRTSATSGSCSSSARSEEHTSELQSRFDLVCRLLLEKKNKQTIHHIRI